MLQRVYFYYKYSAQLRCAVQIDRFRNVDPKWEHKKTNSELALGTNSGAVHSKSSKMNVS